MIITHEKFTTNGITSSAAEKPVESNQSSDMNFFHAEMSRASPLDRGSMSAVASPGDFQFARESAKIAGRLSKGFRDASQMKGAWESGKFPQLLAEAHVDAIANVKVIGAIAKACDKISSMG
ncbi:hypothetical protein [Pseudomonas costantinii]|uniref:Uncharacterized protein n=2 Tax=Pseudomonas costantinii TaxID=168469 RepID=A0A1S2UT85_9PSED|nr:hypothetical protein [Pseudomonas costantinii]OIN49355.1 hypothetical protein BFL40_21640 [Pseudomonas costantinii]